GFRWENRPFRARRWTVFSHVFVGVTDFERALAFYDAMLAPLGVTRRFCEPARPWAGWHGADGSRPLFLVGRPADRRPHAAGNGQMTAFLAADRAAVRAAHAAA